MDFENYKRIRNKVIAEVRKSKQLQVDKLADKLKTDDIGQRDWWRTLKQFIKPEQLSSLPPLYKNGVVYPDSKEQAYILNDFFVNQTILNDDNAFIPATVSLRMF